MTNHPPKSLMRMLGPSGNPQAKNLFKILSALQEKARVQFRLKGVSNRRRSIIEARYAPSQCQRRCKPEGKAAESLGIDAGLA